MPSIDFDVDKIWDDESGEPCPLMIDEIDARIEASTQRVREERTAMERENAQLQTLIAQYTSVVERLEAELRAASINAGSRQQLKEVLHQLSERSASVAASL